MITRISKDATQIKIGELTYVEATVNNQKCYVVCKILDTWPAKDIIEVNPVGTDNVVYTDKVFVVK